MRLKADITAVEEKEREEGLKSCCAGDGGDGAWHWSTVRTEDRKRHYLNICQPLAAMATEAQPPPQPVSGLRSECERDKNDDDDEAPSALFPSQERPPSSQLGETQQQQWLWW